MNRRNIILIVSLFVLVVIGMFAFAYFKQNNLDNNDTVPEMVAQPNDGDYSDVTRIEGKHFFINGVHTIVGEVLMPTPCDFLNVNVLFGDSESKKITLDFSVVNNTETCIQQITPQRFKVTAKADSDVVFDALFQNKAIELNLVEAGPDESPNDFELFIKG